MSEEKTKIYLGDVLISGEDINIDATPTSGSSNAVSSGGVYSAIQSAVSSVYKYKGTKANYASLPSSGNVTGDVWNVEAAYGDYPAGTNWAWTGSGWDALGGEVDLSSYLTKTDASNTYVTALGTSGNNITWTKNGVANSLTVPYATKATQDGSGNTITSHYVTLSTNQAITGSKTFSSAHNLRFAADTNDIISPSYANAVPYSPLLWNA